MMSVMFSRLQFIDNRVGTFAIIHPMSVNYNTRLTTIKIPGIKN